MQDTSREGSPVARPCLIFCNEKKTYQLKITGVLETKHRLFILNNPKRWSAFGLNSGKLITYK